MDPMTKKEDDISDSATVEFQRDFAIHVAISPNQK